MGVRKICVVTGARSEFGLLHWLLKEIDNASGLRLQLIATGMHLSPEFGLTWKTIESEGFHIDKKVEMLMSSDTPGGISKSIALGVIGFSDAFEELRPDLLVILGDRFEIFSAAVAAISPRIPVAHIHGGETTEGCIDEALRHSITKISHLHFTAAEVYKKRVIQLGENPKQVFNVGSLGIDNINKIPLLDRDSFEKSIKFKLGNRNLLITYHPVTLEVRTCVEQVRTLLKVLDSIPDTHFIITKPNADTDGRKIIKLIDNFVKERPDKSAAFVSLGQLRYLSALQFVDGVVGNSSSGIIEAPSFKIGTINIGDRQKGRLRCNSIIDCGNEEDDIRRAVSKLYSHEFKSGLKTLRNPYGKGGAAKKICDIIKTFSLKNLVKKSFYDIDITEVPKQ